MNAAKMMGVGPATAAIGGPSAVGGGPSPMMPGIPMLGMMGKIGEMRVPAAGLSPTVMMADDFDDSDDYEEGLGDDADGDSSVCSNGE